MLVIFFALTPSLALAIDRGYIEWVYCPTSAKVGSYIEFKVKVTCISKSNINQPWKAILCVDYNGDKNGEDWPASCQPDIYIKPGESKVITCGFVVPSDILSKLPEGQNGFYVYFDLWNTTDQSKIKNRVGKLGSTSLKFIKLENLITVQRSTVTIYSDPSGASVYLDGTYIGTTPIEDYVVVPGTHTITVLKEGYQQISKVITVKEGENNIIRVSLEPLVKPTPSSVTTYVNAKTPEIIVDLSSSERKLIVGQTGTITLTVKNSGDIDVYVSVDLYLPNGITISRSPIGGSVSGNLVTWMGVLESGRSHSIYVEFSPNDVGNYKFQAFVKYKNANVEEPYKEDKCVCTVEVVSPHLESLNLDVTPANVNVAPGDEVPFKVSLSWAPIDWRGRIVLNVECQELPYHYSKTISVSSDTQQPYECTIRVPIPKNVQPGSYTVTFTVRSGSKSAVYKSVINIKEGIQDNQLVIFGMFCLALVAIVIVGRVIWVRVIKKKRG
jgi:hypothetical protein